MAPLAYGRLGSLPSAISAFGLVAMLVAILVCLVLSWACPVLSMWLSYPPKSKKREKPVENGLCGVF